MNRSTPPALPQEEIATRGEPMLDHGNFGTVAENTPQRHDVQDRGIRGGDLFPAAIQRVRIAQLVLGEARDLMRYCRDPRKLRCAPHAFFSEYYIKIYVYCNVIPRERPNLPSLGLPLRVF